jgi:FkbM family methyltransferase
MDLTGFDWGWMNEGEGLFHKNSITQEIFIDKIYERFAQVQEKDIVLDIGASVGPFTYSILDKKPSKVFCIEPSISEFITLTKNLGEFSNITLVNKGITSINGIVESNELFEGESEMEGITFKDFIQENNIDRIDFLKTDCEGGEYDIFHIDNFCWLKENLGVTVGEWHLSTSELKDKFRVFRDVFLRLFPNHEIYSVDGVDIKWDLWNEHFTEYYNEVIIYINNKK